MNLRLPVLSRRTMQIALLFAFTFLGSALRAQNAPLIQASNIIVNPGTNNEMTVSWTKGNGSGRVVFIKETISSTETVLLYNNNYYGANPNLATDGNWQCVYNGTGESVKVKGVLPGVFYRIHVCEYNSPSSGSYQYNTSAAIGNPLSPSIDNPNVGQYGYNFEASSGAFSYLSGGATINFSSDYSNSIPLGFTFSYFGKNYTQCKVSPFGLITFNTSNYMYGPLIAPLWANISSGQVSYKTVGVSPNQAFVVEWKQCKWSASASSPAISFQAWLYENGKVEYIYKDELGPINNASGSIALIRHNRKFYSLANASSSPLMAPTPAPGDIKWINAKPATNQVYAFTPSASNVIAPTVPVSNLTATDVGMYGMKLNWTKSTDSEFTALFINETSIEEDMPIQNETYYGASSVFLQGSSAEGSIPSTGWKWQCIYNGTGSSVELTALRAGYNYRIQAFAYNGQAATQKYQTSPTTITQATPVVAPTGNPFSRLDPVKTTKSELFYFLNAETKYAEGAKRVIFIKENSGEAVAPAVDNTTYTPSEIFGNGSQIGSTGWFCVFNGVYDGRPNVGGPVLLKVAGLNPSTSYNIHVVDYNGMPSLEKYNTAAAEGNHFQFTTKNANATPYSFIASSNPYTTLSGGTDLNSIEKDYALSDAIDIGFDFTFSGNSFTKLKVSSDGFLTFNLYADKSFYDQNSTVVKLTQDEYMRSVIAPLWGNLEGINGQASYKIDGVAPNRTFTVEWKNWRSYWPFGGPVTVSFQAILFETTNAIEFRYKQEAGATPSTSISAKIGISYPGNQPGKSFFVLNNSSSSPTPSYTQQFYSVSNLPAINQVYRFVPVEKLDQTIDFPLLASRTIKQGNFSITANAGPNLPITFTSSNPEVATVSGNLVTVVGVGKTTITASQVGDDFYNPASVNQELEIKDGTQSITFTNPGNKTLGGASFRLSATSSSGLSVTYSTSTPGIISISGNTVTIKAVGTATIRAQQSGNYQYYAATPVDVSFQIISNKTDQTIEFPNPGDKNAYDPSFLLSAYSTSGLPITYSTTTPEQVYISGNLVYLNGVVGTAKITAYQSGNTQYNAAPPVEVTFTIKLTPVITWSNSIWLKTNTSSGNQWYKDGVAIPGATSQYLAASPGTYTVQLTSGEYVSDFSAPLVVKEKNQTITFSELPYLAIDASMDLNAFAQTDSGLPITYTVNDPLIATIDGSTVTAVAEGIVEITASQPGDEEFNPADKVIQFLTVSNRTPQNITFNLQNEAYINDGSITLTATADSQLPVSYETMNEFVATISNGNILNLVGPGFTEITATQAGDAIFNTAPPQTRFLFVFPGSNAQEEESSVAAYPNEVEEELTVDVSLFSKEETTVTMYDLTGRKIDSKTGRGVFQFDVKDYKRGNYVLKATSGTRVISRHIKKK